MLKRFSKRKVQFLAQQSLSDMDEFGELYVSVVKCFRAVGLCPVKIVRVKGYPKFEVSRPLVAIMVFILLSCWVALLASFFMDRRSPLITGIANHIQAITNVLALTVTIGGPVLNSKDLNAILDDFGVIDNELGHLNMKLPQSQMKTNFWKCYMTHVLFLILTTGYDGYVRLILTHNVQLWMWFFHLLPFMMYSLAFMKAFIMIKWVKIRIQRLNSLIEQYHRYPLLDRIETVEFKISSIKLKVEEDKVVDTVKMNEEFTTNNRILRIVSKTIDLSDRLESYNGLLFLFGYLALFSITTIQVYYCYLHVTIPVPENGYTKASFALSLVIIVGNLIAIFALPYICEQVLDESKTLMSYLSKLSMKQSHNVQSAIWFPNLISNIKFSALGFFNINYSMLSGFFAGLITYLIIFIQFNAMAASDGSITHMTRTNANQRQPNPTNLPNPPN